MSVCVALVFGIRLSRWYFRPDCTNVSLVHESLIRSVSVVDIRYIEFYYNNLE